MINTTLDIAFLILAALIIALAGLLIYIAILLERIECLLHRLKRPPEVLRDGNGRRLRERL